MFVVLFVVIVTGAPAAPAATTLVFEGESYTWLKASMRKVSDSAAAKGAYMEIPLQRPHAVEEGKPFDDGSVTFKINVPQAGRYQLWARAWWYDGCGNSFFVMVDDLSAAKAKSLNDSTYQKWHWVRGHKYNLSAGYHLIRFQNREDGARLDQFLLTTSSRFVPTRKMTETRQYLWQPSE